MSSADPWWRRGSIIAVLALVAFAGLFLVGRSTGADSAEDSTAPAVEKGEAREPLRALPSLTLAGRIPRLVKEEPRPEPERDRRAAPEPAPEPAPEEPAVTTTAETVTTPAPVEPAPAPAPAPEPEPRPEPQPQPQPDPQPPSPPPTFDDSG